MPSELVKIVGSLAVVAIAVAAAAFVFRRVFAHRAEAWGPVIEGEAGTLKAVLRLNSVLSAQIPLPSQTTLWFEQWEMRTDGTSFGQVVIKIRNPKWSIVPFFVGSDGHAGAFARWALRLPKRSGPTRAPLDQARAADGETVGRYLPPPIVTQLEALRVYFVSGAHGLVRLHLPGGARGSEGQAHVREWVALAKAMEQVIDQTERTRVE